jgi:hypothetical protein
MKKRNIKKMPIRFRLLIVAVFVLLMGTVQADPCDPGPDPNNPVDCPIDSGVYILLASVIGIAGFKAYQAKNKKTVSL